MNQLILKHQRLLANLKTRFRRGIIDQIHWKERLVGLKGARGVGKTTLILQHINEIYGNSDKCLYVSMDDLTFPFKNLVELAEVFSQRSGQYLFIDEIHKQPEWITQLKNIYDTYTDLNIVFSGSSILQLDHSKADLSRRAILHNMHGLSFREFVQIETKQQFSSYSFEEIIQNHKDICFEIASKIKPLKYFTNYLKYGYYPYFLENLETYPIKLSGLINQAIEYDLGYMVHIDLASIARIKRFVYFLCQNVPFKPNLSKIGSVMECSRQTIANYIQYLNKCDILEIVYDADKSLKTMSKPEKLLLHHPNLYYAICGEQLNMGSMRETFFVNQVSYANRIQIASRGDFLVNEKYCIEIGGKNKTSHQLGNIPNAFLAADDIEFGVDNKIPLWVFGFLY